MALGNGGLGRLAACFLDSLATLDLPAVGYGIHYQYGLFKQEFRNGHQVELPDAWLTFGTPWEIVRPEHSTEVQIYGQVENVFDDRGNYVPRWTGTKKIVGVPYDIPIPGFGTNTVDFLRLWESRAPEGDFRLFQSRRLRRGRAGKEHRQNDLESSHPERQTDSGKELAPRCSSGSSSPARCATSSAASARTTKRGRIFRRRSSSSSTTRIPPSPSSSSSGSFMTCMAWRGTKPGRWSRAPLPTPITRSSPRRWKSGACRSSRRCSRGTSNSSSRSTSASSSKSRPGGRATSRKSASSRSSRKATCRWCAWRISRSSAASP